MTFNIEDYVNINKNRYQTYLDSLDLDPRHIKKTVSSAMDNILNKNSKSFVIYGEPQSGKTSMMIALTAKLLDSGYKFIIILTQDILFLENQNRARFEDSTLSPSPKSFVDILPKEENIKDRENVIFCKKNNSNLKRLLDRVGSIKNKVIIDDEADYATPNSKINKLDDKGNQEKTRINERVFNLLGDDGYYIGVTATPARLDLNNTFQNENYRWVFFNSHDNYKGKDFFFPLSIAQNKTKLGYHLKLLADESTSTSKELKEAIYRFLINAAYLKCYSSNSNKTKNYIMLIHTSGKIDDHSDDSKVTKKILGDLSEKEGKNFNRHIENIYNLAFKRFKKEEIAKTITLFIARYGDNNQVGILNSDKDNKKGFDLIKFSEKPSAIFTIAIGGNIISRGITFTNLLSIFFTRSVKNLMQQDTYIQRARMFGNRDNDYIKEFELTIPESLYNQWWRCFMLNRLAYQSAINNLHPVWLEGDGTRAVSPSSIDKPHIRIDKGEICFERIDYNDGLDKILSLLLESSLEEHKGLLTKIATTQIKEFLPYHILEFIQHYAPQGSKSIALHDTAFIDDQDPKYSDTESISRPRGIFGASDYKKFPLATHHFKCMRNRKGKVRMFYNFQSVKIKFLKNIINKS